MKQLKLSTEDCVVSAWINTSGFYGFVVFKTVEEATGAMTHLNSMQIGTSTLKIGRPHTPKLGVVPGQVGLPVGNPVLTNSIPVLTIPSPPKNEILSNCIMVTNIPTLINEIQIKELLNSYGKLKAFNLIKNSGGETQISVLEYEDNSVTEVAMKGLEEITLGLNKLIVQKVPVQNVSLLMQPTNLQSSSSQELTSLNSETIDPLADYPTSTVIRLLNMVSSEDLSDDELYMELLEDVGEECNSHGTVKSIQVPRSGNGVGEVFVHFLHQIGAVKTKEAIAGRSYAGKIVCVTFYPEELFESKTFKIPDDYNLKTNISNINTVIDIDDL
jgi:splicing factor U2AF subunit